jgi:hypothetical protein
VLAKEINVFMRCSACQCKASMSYSSQESSAYKCTSRTSCRNNSSSQLSSGFHVWWHGVLVFDDSSGEVQVCLEGAHLLKVLRDLYEGGRGRGTSREKEAGGQKVGGAGGASSGRIDKNMFSVFQASIEEHVTATCSLVSYSFASAAMARGYCSLQDTDHGVCSDDMTSHTLSSAASSTDHEQSHRNRCITNNHRSVHSVYNDYYDRTCTNLIEQRYMDKMKHIQSIQALLQACSFAVMRFEIYVKIIFHQNQCFGSSSGSSSASSSGGNTSSDGLSLSLCRALGRLDSTKGSMSVTAGGGPRTFIRKVKVQCANVPPWVVENVELPSEAIATLQLQCVHCAPLTSAAGGGAPCSALPTSSLQAWAQLALLRDM